MGLHISEYFHPNSLSNSSCGISLMMNSSLNPALSLSSTVGLPLTMKALQGMSAPMKQSLGLRLACKTVLLHSSDLPLKLGTLTVLPMFSR